MIRTRIAQALVVAAIALTAIAFAPSAATASAPVGAPVPTVTLDSFGWGG
ncbi:hypothetical protein [Kitasatospora sp. NPDC091276]